MKNLNNERIQYCLQHSQALDKATELALRSTNLYAYHPEMASAPIQGKYLKNMCQIKQANNILEIGTFSGYATLCMAEGMHPDGKIESIELDPENYSIAKKNIEASPFSSRIKLYLGNAIEIIPTLGSNYDLVFIDAAKKLYWEFFELILPKMQSGGLILVDNVLWFDKVIKKDKDSTTQAIHDFNIKISKDHRIDHFILPIEDGIQVLIKK